MRRGLIGVLLAALVLAASACSSAGTTGLPGSTSGESAGVAYDEKAIKAGEVEVKVKPVELDATSAAFTVTLDTHTVPLDMDLAATSRLEVNGTPWPNPSWEGDPPGSGHHRQGTLRFRASGTPGIPLGTATLTISGLPTPATFTWTTDGG